jgi:hypothetical protein
MIQQRQKVRRQKVVICDCCGERKATERHHIINKYMTMGNDKARMLANQAEITSLICQPCHQELVDKPHYRDILFRELFQLWDYETIRNIYDAIDESLRSGLPWHLPEEIDGKE